MDKKAEGKKEGSGDLSKQSLNGMLGPGDVDYDEEGFVVEREKPKMIAYDIVARNPRTQMRLSVVNLRVLVGGHEDHGAFRMVLAKSKNVISYSESAVIKRRGE